MRLPVLPHSLQLPPTGWTLAGLLAFYVFAGLFGHDPWVSEDVINLAVARDFLDAGHGLGLSLAGRPFFAPPLYYWSAALSEALTGWLLPTHDALRLASGLWTALTLMALYYAGREIYGQQAAAATPLLMAGSFGLIVHAHEAQPMLVLLTALSFWLLAFALLPRKPRPAMLLLGLAFLLAALGGGLAGWLLLTLVFFSVFAVFRVARQQAGRLFGSFLASLVLLGAILGLLYLAAPEWFLGWIAHEWAMLRGTWRYGRDLMVLLDIFPWFSWPLWPLAGWMLWRNRRYLFQPGVLLPLAVFLVLFLWLPVFFPVRKSTAILILPPLALLATPGVLTLRQGAANAFDWFSGTVFTVFAILAWTGWSAAIFGVPARLAERAVVLKPGFVGHFDVWFFILAIIVTLWWLWLLLAMPRSSYRCLTRWSAGFAIGWLLAASLWLPWIDYGKSYRSVATNLAAAIPEEEKHCVAEWQVGEARIASFAYFERLHLLPLSGEGSHCRWLLVEGRSRTELMPPGEGWQRVWEGNRPGDRRERFRLYRRDEAT
ncbi:MAG: glycosyltransferase family 39 protein [Zoogloeaceae bacterium]|jgi:4-amino-4-deoxy-L-arabinose transferase-like glycosyltransferase|nr:glycosyltransferase family 39 protein [Zoogloeaceae bacterium]